jgi:hypothetical protein
MLSLPALARQYRVLADYCNIISWISQDLELNLADP